jgi:hypothetical protein
MYLKSLIASTISNITFFLFNEIYFVTNVLFQRFEHLSHFYDGLDKNAGYTITKIIN